MQNQSKGDYKMKLTPEGRLFLNSSDWPADSPSTKLRFAFELMRANLTHNEKPDAINALRIGLAVGLASSHEQFLEQLLRM